MKIVELKLSEIKPYERNPRKNDRAVEPVAESIRQFGFKQPIVIDKDGVIVAGHTRYKAAQKLGLETVPCVRADDLTPTQVKAYRIADNKLNELAVWDFNALNIELSSFDFDFEPFQFEFPDLNIQFESWGPTATPQNTEVSNQDSASVNNSNSENEGINTDEPTEYTRVRDQDENLKQWEGMPEYVGTNAEGFLIVMHFRTLEDKLKFADVVGQKVYPTTKYLYWPEPTERRSQSENLWK